MADIIANESTIIPNGNVYLLEEGDNLTVNEGVALSTSGNGDEAVFGEGSNNVIINGAAAGTTGVALDEDSTLTIGSRGFVAGTYIGAYIYDDGTVNNSGTISGTDYGLLLYNGSTLVNSGLIQSGPEGFAAVEVSGADDDTFDIINSGNITAKDGGYSYLSDYDSIDTIRNSGTMTGDIDLGGGNDSYGGKGGQVVGTIFGNDGDDYIGGGAEANRMSGGDGNDILNGRGGNDTFIFDTAPNRETNLDHIRDFTNSNARGNNDRFELLNGDGTGPFAAVTAGSSDGKIDADAFATVRSSQATVGEDVRILYKQSTGTVYYDADGGDAGNRVAFAVIDNHDDVRITYNDFFVV